LLDVYVQFPQAEWKPVYLYNPLNQSKILGTEWWYEGGTITIDSSAFDYWGVWKIKFVSWNYVQDLELGKAGGPYSMTFSKQVEIIKVFSFDLNESSISVRIPETNRVDFQNRYVKKKIQFNLAFVAFDYRSFPKNCNIA